MKSVWGAGMLALALSLAACSQNTAPAAPEAAAAAPNVVVEDAWIAASPQGVAIAAGYVTLRNAGDAPDRLVSLSSPSAPRVELHTMSMDGGVMQMRPIEALEIPANGAVALEPGGDHIMFVDLPEPLADGETVSVTMTFETQDPMTVDFAVRDRAAPHAMEH
ncbi:MAG: copper chaperone PCu(A)C [Alphaproteobacteria bacterium]|nr:copper chaperone PCu(A)C [Alphaproteobacteria bacterium]